MSDFRKLLVWRKAHVLAIRVHNLANGIRGQQNAEWHLMVARGAGVINLSRAFFDGRMIFLLQPPPVRSRSYERKLQGHFRARH